jgi:error-prone DNA polymerase
MTDTPLFAELHAHSFFSLLDGASSPEALAERAAALGHYALALTDHDSLAGVMRFRAACATHKLKPVIGAELTVIAEHNDPTPAHLTVLAETPQGYANLSTLITRARCDHTRIGAAEWTGKVSPRLTLQQLSEHSTGLIVLTGCDQGWVSRAARRGDLNTAGQTALVLAEVFGRHNVYIELQHHDRPGDSALVDTLAGVAAKHRLPVIATGNTHYASASHARLRDCLIAIDRNETLTEAHLAGALPFNHSYALPAAREMYRRFARYPQAIANTLTVAERCWVDLDPGASGVHRMPAFPTPDGQTEFGYLYALCHAGLRQRYPRLQPQVLKQLAHELKVIEDASLSGFFLTVWDIARFARERGIQCSGRGSAAGSIVAYLLNISQVDPLEHELLFERFLAPDKTTMPDIDLDFDWSRREEVIQYVYARYGHAHCAMVCNHIQFQARSAIRDLGKTLNVAEPVIERLLKRIDSHDPVDAADALDAWLDESHRAAHDTEQPLRLLTGLLRQIDGVVRHLGIHSGGMIITREPIAGIVPVEPATMPGRYVTQWDKDSVEDAGRIKIDLLSLRTLGMIDEALKHVGALSAPGQPPPSLDDLGLDDPAVYQTICEADNLEIFQVSSRAQLQMLHKTQPRSLKELAIEIAIVRPGPIQGGAVHPYVNRRTGREPVTYDHPDLAPVLKDTLGVLLYQEDCLRIAMVMAGFSAGEADQLRRAMSRSRSREAMREMAGLFTVRAAARGYSPETASAVFSKIAQFASFGFCRSHAASFARISYITAWLKRNHPGPTICAYLNSGAGMYPHNVVINEMKREGIRMLPLDINSSRWAYVLADQKTIRMAASTVHGLGEAQWTQIEDARMRTPFRSLADFQQRVTLPKPLLLDLIRAGLFDSFGPRRDLLWQTGERRNPPDDALPVLEDALAVVLPELAQITREIWDHELTGVSLGGVFMRHFEPALARLGVTPLAQAKELPAGKRVRIAGMLYIRQRPKTAKGVTFLGLQDSTGLCDVVLKAETYQRCRQVLRGDHILIADGVVQSDSGAVSVLAHTVRALDEMTSGRISKNRS